MKISVMKKILARAAMLLMVVVLGLSLVTAFLSITGLGNRLGWMPWSLLTVRGESMAPQMQPGDLLIIYEADYDSLQIGDDVTFISANELVTHRITGKTAQGFITRGLANNIDDLYPMGPASYCGKVVLQIPVMGSVLHTLWSSAAMVFLCILLIFVFCFGEPVVRRLCRKKTGPLNLQTRLIACLTCLSLLLSLPYMTEAKYTAQINKFETAVADVQYLSSNYLSTQGNTYSIQGWNGRGYTINLQIRNYDNALLYNNFDISYGIGIKTYDQSGDYSVMVTPGEGNGEVLKDGAFSYPESWTDIETKGAYTLTGGTKTAHSFSVTITPNDPQEPLPPGTEIRFEIYACTNQDEYYVSELKGSFQLQVAQTSNFISQQSISDTGSMVKASITTALSADADDEEIVCFRWNPNILYINEFESTAFSIISTHRDYFRKEQGCIYMKLQAFSKVELEFFKKVDEEITDDDFQIEVVESIPSLEDETIWPTEEATDPNA